MYPPTAVTVAGGQSIGFVQGVEGGYAQAVGMRGVEKEGDAAVLPNLNGAATLPVWHTVSYVCERDLYTCVCVSRVNVFVGSVHFCVTSMCVYICMCVYARADEDRCVCLCVFVHVFA
jgi:hypothetical protein